MASGRNIVVVLAHGLRSDALEDAQQWPLSTPHFQELSARGLRLVAGSACPADPGGALSLLTGLHARQHGFVDHSQHSIAVDGWPAQLADAGYHMVGVGCVADVRRRLHDSVVVESVDAVENANCAYLAGTSAKGMSAAIYEQRKQRLRCGPFDPRRVMLQPEDDIDGFIASQACLKLAQMPTDRPWMLLVMFSGPGNDLAPPTMYDELVAPRDLEGGFVPVDFTKLDALAELDYPRVTLQRLDPQRIGRIRADYLGRVSLIDYGIGRLMAAVNRRPDSERSWFVLSSDRGYLLGEHGLVGHRSFLAGALDVPLIVVPSTPMQMKCGEGLVSTVDVAATVAHVAGCDMPQACSGRSVLDMMSEGKHRTSTGGACLAEFGRRLMLETEQYKIVFDTESQAAIGLFDMLHDNEERENLVSTSVGRNVLDSLRWRLGDALMPLRAMAG